MAHVQKARIKIMNILEMKKNVFSAVHLLMDHAQKVHMESISMVPVPINVFFAAAPRWAHAHKVLIGSTRSNEHEVRHQVKHQVESRLQKYRLTDKGKVLL